jgi:hypothetical protein
MEENFEEEGGVEEPVDRLASVQDSREPTVVRHEDNEVEVRPEH